jgi:glycosyltransferase involved in cell wall biosynthesis
MSGIAAYEAKLGHEWTVFAHQLQADNAREMCPGANIVPVAHETATRVIQEELRRNRFDVLFSPLLILEPLRSGIPSAVTIPDLQHEFYPEFFGPKVLQWRRETFRPSVFYSDVVFTISEYSKRTIVEKFHADPQKIVVVDLATDPEFQTSPSPQAQASFRDLRLFDEYIYYPANYWEHKNHVTLLRAMKVLRENGHPDLGLVLTGSSDGVERVQREIGALDLESAVRILSYQPREVIAEIYRHSRALVFASRFEGFGIPLLEAFHTGTPVVSSSAGSLPEVAGDAALLVDEMSPKSIAAGVGRILRDDGLRTQLVERGFERVRKYEWTGAVDLTIEWLERIAQSTRVSIQVDSRPTVSIVTPSFNMGKFIQETIESVLAQEYPHIEYLVMDGGSTDETLAILRQFEGKLRYTSAKDGGQANAINRGFAESSGEIFAFLNADDTYLPGAVGTAVRHLRANPSVGAVYGEAYYTDEDGTVTERYPTGPFDYQRLNRNCYICQPAAFMMRDAFSAVGGMNESLHYALDYDLWIRMAKVYPLLKVDDYLATSRMHSANKTLGSRRQVYMEILSLAKAHYGYVPFDWVVGYASYLMRRGSGAIERPPAKPSAYLLSLLLGCYYNRSQRWRYAKEWAAQLGPVYEFTGRWKDGWISRRYVTEIAVPEDCVSLQLEGRHQAPIRSGLTITVRLNGRPIESTHLRTPGPFSFIAACPAQARGRTSILEIESSETFRRFGAGGYRKLSCVIDAVKPVSSTALVKRHASE